MQIKLSGHHVEITQALHDYVHDKLERIERHFDNVTSAQVILSVEKLNQKAEATIHAVSYTHLDVYKRQPHSLSKPARINSTLFLFVRRSIKSL